MRRTLMVFQGGRKVADLPGDWNAADVRQWLDKEGRTGIHRAEWHSIASVAPTADRPPDLRLVIPEAKAPNRWPDLFYRDVAALAEALVTAGDRSPAKTIAVANGVPHARVRMWIHEARRRGVSEGP